MGDIVRELDPGTSGNRGPAANFKDDKKLAVVQGEPNIDLYLNYRGNAVEMDGDAIVAVIAEARRRAGAFVYGADVCRLHGRRDNRLPGGC